MIKRFLIILSFGSLGFAMPFVLFNINNFIMPYLNFIMPIFIIILFIQLIRK